MHTVAVLVGSLRKESINLKFTKALEKLGADLFAFAYVDLDLPLYNEDLWTDPPPGVLKLKEQVAAADAVLFVTPEYNRSIPPVIKNALDWGSRPMGKSCWPHKPSSIAGTSPGGVGTAVAQSQLRAILVALDVRLMGQPEVQISFKKDFLDAEGAIADEGTRKFLRGYLEKFDRFIG